MPTINDGSKHFQAVTYTGNGSTNTITGFSFQPDFVWIKGRSGATDHAIYDAVRGTTLDLASNTTAAETTQSTGLTAFNSTGFTLGALSKVNTNGATYVAWGWKGGNGTVSNTSGSITSTVSANTSAGFSVVAYSGTSGSATVGHGLGVVPSLILVKQRSGGAGWRVYSSSLANTQALEINATGAAFTQNVWNNTTPTSSVFSVTDAVSTWTNGSGQTYVAYCFAPVSGYSAFGSYTGNGSTTDGPFVFCGFRPRFIIIKMSSSADSWVIEDSSRNTYNVDTQYLAADSNGAEGSTALRDILSNGFKMRSAAQNVSGGTYIYAAFAENPFKYSRAR